MKKYKKVFKENTFISRKELKESNKINFEDWGWFWATEEMMNKNFVLSLTSKLIYNISNEKDVKIIRVADINEIKRAIKEVKKDLGAFIGNALIYYSNKTLHWDF